MQFGKTFLVAMLGVAALATSAHAQMKPTGTTSRAVVDPLSLVPAERAAQMQANGGATDRVVGGHLADAGEFPFQVGLLATARITSDRQSQYQAQFCGGSLIAPQWILTAAHCVTDQEGIAHPGSAITALMGTNNLMEGTLHPVELVIAHEQYNNQLTDYDVALLKLKTPVNAPVVKIDDGSAVTDKGTAKVIGWGMMINGSTPADLLEADIDLVPNAVCNEGMKGYAWNDFAAGLVNAWGWHKVKPGTLDTAMWIIDQGLDDPLTDRMMCAGTKSGQMGACHGDSGGPLMIMGAGGPVQVGVVSWGGGPTGVDMYCGYEDVYGVYAKVSFFRDWIRQKSGI